MSALEGFREFLESSTIHGLVYIATTRRLARLLWILIVIGGFSGASFLIYKSFQDWSENPISTTIVTKPITEITFPKVTVCPPKNTYTDLNYDLQMSQNMTISSDTRKELLNYAVNLLNDHIYDTVMTEFRMLDEENRYYNWYHGKTNIQLPYQPSSSYDKVYRIFTTATSGSVATEYFGQTFDAEKVVPKILYDVTIFPPRSLRSNENVTLNVVVDKVSLKMKDLFGMDEFWAGDTPYGENVRNNDFDMNPPPSDELCIQLKRIVAKEDIEKMNLDLMPGFKVRWNFSGDINLPEFEYELQYYNVYNEEYDYLYYDNKYSTYEISRAFVRSVSVSIFIFHY